MGWLPDAVEGSEFDRPNELVLASCMIGRGTAVRSSKRASSSSASFPRTTCWNGLLLRHSWSAWPLLVVNGIEMKATGSVLKGYDLFSSVCYWQFGRSQPEARARGYEPATYHWTRFLRSDRLSLASNICAAIRSAGGETRNFVARITFPWGRGVRNAESWNVESWRLPTEGSALPPGSR